MSRPDAAAVDLALIDASAPGLARADLIFVFGTRLARPAQIAAELLKEGLAPLVVVTGGAARQADSLNEADHHVGLLVRAGIPDEAIIVENRSTTTSENVTHALPVVARRCGPPRSVIAVVKWFHRRAVVTLAHHAPSVDRIFAVTYEPIDPATGKFVTPETWWLHRDRIEKESAYMRSLLDDGFDPLVAGGHGWQRSAAPMPR